MVFEFPNFPLIASAYKLEKEISELVKYVSNLDLTTYVQHYYN